MRYYRSGCEFPLSSHQPLIHIASFCWLMQCFTPAFPRSLLWVLGDGNSENQVRRMNPGRPGGSKRYHASEAVAASPSAQPMQPKQSTKQVANSQSRRSSLCHRCLLRSFVWLVAAIRIPSPKNQLLSSAPLLEICPRGNHVMMIFPYVFMSPLYCP